MYQHVDGLLEVISFVQLSHHKHRTGKDCIDNPQLDAFGGPFSGIHHILHYNYISLSRMDKLICELRQFLGSP
jgi:hypothetical protein